MPELTPAQPCIITTYVALGAGMTSEPRRLDLAPYLRRQPVTLALLTGLAVLFFLAVSALARIHDAQRESLAERWAGRGAASLNARQFAAAVEDFRTALLYARDETAYQLSLAQALLGLNRLDEAHAYLVNLWEKEPDNGLVSLELARIAVNKGDTEQALRYYHNSIYGTWTGDQDTARRTVRLELISYLMRINAHPQAEAELIDLASTVGDDPEEQAQLGDMFTKVGDYQRALTACRASLRLQHHNPAALADAGAAAYQLGQYGDAEHYLQQALDEHPSDTQTEQRLKMTEDVLRWDPFRPQISQQQQIHIVLAAFSAAGERLKSCKTLDAHEPDLQQQWTKLKPQVTERNLSQNSDLMKMAMNLVFSIEKETASTCGAQTDTDEALLLVSSLHEEN
jgi:tetratricopeptide (TPR) repeat protein